VAAISVDCLKLQPPEEVHPLIVESWNTLRSMPHASYLALTVPRFMLRWPYGQKTEPIESFRFEEFTPQSGLKAMLWANGSMLAGLLLGKTFSEQGVKGMRLGSIMTLGDVPFYYYTDAEGDQVALPNTERLVTESTAAYLMSQNFMPVLCIRGRPEVRLGSFQSLAGTELAGPWMPVAIEPDQKAPPGQAAEQPEETVPTVDAFEAQAAAEAESELDALLASLMADTTTPATADAEAPASAEPTAATDEVTEQAAGSVDDLDELLAGLAASEAETNSDNSQMDSDLADLLASL
jgi:type VI secretion system protein ImpC